MTYVITDACVDIKDKSCIEQCPVDCIYEGGRALYINPDECIECGACEPVCPVEAVYFDAELPRELEPALASNAAFFTATLPGRTQPLGSPRGFKKVGAIAADSDYVAVMPGRRSADLLRDTAR
jgi:NAD-dependent dihydropyrimidine dehydrogenase PreA subunit